MDFIISILWFLLPAGVANMFPSLFSKIKFGNWPIDFGKKFFDGKEIFGSHKTYRGFVVGILGGMLTIWIQANYFDFMKGYWLIDYNEINILWLGFLMSFGALFGDLVKSFLKRRVSKKPGEIWFPFDQIDWILGVLIFISFVKIFDWKFYISAILVWGFLHPVVNLIGYYLKIKKNKF